MSGVDTFTQSMRILSVILSVTFLAMVIEFALYRWTRRRSTATDRRGHCTVVKAPLDWAEHRDWVK